MNEPQSHSNRLQLSFWQWRVVSHVVIGTVFQIFIGFLVFRYALGANYVLLICIGGAILGVQFPLVRVYSSIRELRSQMQGGLPAPGQEWETFITRLLTAVSALFGIVVSCFVAIALFLMKFYQD